MGVGNHKLYAAQSTSSQVAQELQPERLGLAWPNRYADDFLYAIGIYSDGDYHGDRNGRIDPQVRPITFDRSIQERTDGLVNLTAQRDSWLFDMPVAPIARTNSSTERVDTP